MKYTKDEENSIKCEKLSSEETIKNMKYMTK